MMARFGLVGTPDSSFDVVTTHPTSLQELSQHAPISAFIAAATGPRSRTSRPYYPAVVLGDFNLPGESAIRHMSRRRVVEARSVLARGNHAGVQRWRRTSWRWHWATPQARRRRSAR
jgi:endonuclease/exonuclease/phosphatase family metal-dependent hydrolase